MPDVIGRDAVFEGSVVDVHAAYAAIASRISSERDSVIDSLGCLPFRCPFARATGVPSVVRMLIRSRSNSATIASTLNNSADRVGGVVPAAAEAESDALRRHLVGDVPCVLHRAGKSVELGDHECVVRADRSERLAQPRSPPVRARQSVVNVDVRIENPQSQQAVPPRGEA